MSGPTRQRIPQTHSVRAHLRLELDSYDETIRKFIPGYETGLTKAAEAVASIAPELVLDLGAGTGALSAEVLRHDGVKHLTAIDLDPEMIQQAKERLRVFGTRVSFREASFLDPLPECDGVTASLALHHVPSLGEKRHLYQRIHACLRPGGVFANADVTMAAHGDERQATYDRWADHLVACGIDRARAFAHFAEWAEEDYYFPLDTELQLMRDAGFDAHCLWQAAPNCVLVGIKKEQTAS